MGNICTSSKSTKTLPTHKINKNTRKSNPESNNDNNDTQKHFPDNNVSSPSAEERRAKTAEAAEKRAKEHMQRGGVKLELAEKLESMKATEKAQAKADLKNQNHEREINDWIR